MTEDGGVIPDYGTDEDEDLDAIFGITADTGLTPEAIFCREYIKTGDAKIACVRAGMTDSQFALSVQAESVLARPEIQAALEVLRDNGLKRETVVVTRDLIVEELQAAAEKAFQAGNVASMVSAKKLQSQLLGYLDQTVNINHTVSARDLPLSELRALVSGRLEAGERPALIEGVFRDVEDD